MMKFIQLLLPAELSQWWHTRPVRDCDSGRKYFVSSLAGYFTYDKLNANFGSMEGYDTRC